MLYKAAQLLEEAPDPLRPARKDPSGDEMPVYRLEEAPQDFRIFRSKRGDGWRIKGEAIERAAAMTYWEYYQSVRRFQHILEAMGIDQALRNAGVKPGDTVLIGDHELVWEE